MISPPPVCINCKYFNSLIVNILSCKAFPNGIPNIILSGLNDHSKPLPKQGNSIVFEPIVNPKDN